MKKHLLVISLALFPILAFAENATPRPDVDELLTVMRAEKMMSGMIGQMKAMSGSFVKQANLPAGAAAQSKVMQDKIFALIQTEMSWENMKGAFAEAYAETFTPEEVKAITEFYKSPAGQAFLDKQPLLMQKTMAISQRMMATVMPKMEQLIRSETGSTSKVGGTQQTATPAAVK